MYMQDIINTKIEAIHLMNVFLEKVCEISCLQIVCKNLDLSYANKVLHKLVSFCFLLY